MSSSGRSLRSKPNMAASGASTTVAPSPVPSTISPSQVGIKILPASSKLPGLAPADLRLLRKKQKRLESTASYMLNSLQGGVHLQNALEATLIFAQHEAGTAVCIDAAGWILTCSHCFGESEEEWKENKRKWLLFYTGRAAQVECRAWDPKRDLAIAKIIALESIKGNNGDTANFKSVPLAARAPSTKTPIVCIGQPGSEDLESTDGRPTKYNLVEVSRGTIRGMVRDADPHDNSEIGTLKHDAWTYWGHSGAPLLREADGTLVGLHSSWDDQTAMRHGIPHVAIEQFMNEQLPSLIGSSNRC